MLKIQTDTWETERLESYSTESTLDQGADTFEFEIGMGAQGQNAGKITAGEQVRLFDSKDRQLMVGMIDDVTEADTIKVEGRDFFALAIDAYPEPKRWKNRNPLDILQEIAGEIAFTSVDLTGVTTSQTKLRAFQIEAGDKAASVLQELAEEADCELYVDRLGNLIAANFSDRPEGREFNFFSRDGEANCNLELKTTTDEVFSTIKLYRARSKSPTVETDSVIGKIVTRTLVTREGDVRTSAQAKKRIEQMFRDMKDRMRRWKCSYGGDHAKFGEIPIIGDGALISSYRHNVTDELATVWSVKLDMNKGKGHTTEVELRSREF